MEQENLPPITTIPQDNKKRFIKRILLILILIVVSTVGFVFYRLKYIPKLTDSTSSQRPKIEFKEELEKIATIDQEDLNDFNSIVYPYMPTLSNDGKQIAYVLKKSGKDILVVNNEKSKPFAEIFYPTFASENSHYCAPAYLERRYGDVMMLCNNYESEVFSDIKGNSNFSANFSNDGKHFGFSGKKVKGAEWVVIVDGKEFGPYTGASGVIFSPDGKHFAYIATHNGKTQLFFDGKTKGIYQFETNVFYFDSTGRIILNARDKDGKWYVISDGVNEGFASNDYLSGGIHFSNDSTRYIYFPHLDGKFYAVLDGKQKIDLPQNVDLVRFIGFDSGNKHFAFEAVHRDLQSNNFRSLESYMVVDGVVYGPYNQIGLDSGFRAENGEFIYSASQNNKWFLFADGKMLKEIEQEASNLILSGKDLVFQTDENGSFVHLGNKKYGPYGSVSDLILMGDGRAVFIASDYSSPETIYDEQNKDQLERAREVTESENSYLVVDGEKMTKKYDRIINFKSSDDKNSFAFEGIDKKILIDLIINIRGKTVTIPSANDLEFSHDGSRFAYKKLGLSNKITNFVIDNEIIKDYEFSNVTQSVFSDSGEFAFVGKKNGKYYVVFEEKPSSKGYDRILKAGVSDGKIYYVAISGNEIWRGEFK